MIAFEELKQQIANQQHEGDCIQECYAALNKGLLRTVSRNVCGSTRAGSALATWRVREWTTRNGGLETSGFNETLRSLAARSQDETLIQCALDAQDMLFILFLVPASREIIGCIRVMRRAFGAMESLAALLAKQPNRDACIEYCYQLLVLRLLRAVGDGPTLLSAREALEYSHKQQRTTQEAGVPARGFEHTLRTLATQPPEEPLIQWELEGLPNRSVEEQYNLFILFIRAVDQEVLGGICMATFSKQNYESSTISKDED